MPHENAVPSAPTPPPSGLSRLGGLSAILVAVLLLVSLLSFFVTLPGLGLRNWLVVLFALNAGLGGLPADPLRVLNPLDFAVLILVGVTFLSLRPALGRANRIWSAVAAALPFAGLAILLATHLAGRSSLMGAGLVVAFLMIREPRLQAARSLGASGKRAPARGGHWHRGISCAFCRRSRGRGLRAADRVVSPDWRAVDASALMLRLPGLAVLSY